MKFNLSFVQRKYQLNGTTWTEIKLVLHLMSTAYQYQTMCKYV